MFVQNQIVELLLTLQAKAKRKGNIPSVYFPTSRSLNAYTYGVGKSAKIAITTTLAKVVDKDTLRAVVAHEFYHVLKNHFIKRVLYVCCLVPALMFVTVVYSEIPIAIVTAGLLMLAYFAVIVPRQEHEADMYAATTAGQLVGIAKWLDLIDTRSMKMRLAMLEIEMKKIAEKEKIDGKSGVAERT